MTGPTHAIGGAALGTAIAVVTHQSISAALLGVVLCTAAALAPDRIQYTIKAARFPLEGHRGLSHTILFALLTTWLIRPDLAPYWCAGMLSHILLDVITVAGVPLFWPIYRRRVSLSLTTNGSAGEAVIRALLIAALVMLWLAPLA